MGYVRYLLGSRSSQGMGKEDITEGKREVHGLEPKSKTVVAKSDLGKNEEIMAEHSEERNKICNTLKEESLPDFFLKFGLITSLIDDVDSFKRQVSSDGNLNSI